PRARAQRHARRDHFRREFHRGILPTAPLRSIGRGNPRLLRPAPVARRVGALVAEAAALLRARGSDGAEDDRPTIPSEIPIGTARPRNARGLSNGKNGASAKDGCILPDLPVLPVL